MSAGNSVHNTNCPVDTVPPTIELIGSDTICVALQSVYVDMGATAFDSCDGDVTSNIVSSSSVDTRFRDTYIESYYVSDYSGNISDTITRVVHVVDPTYAFPGIGLLALDTVYLPVGSSFDPLQFIPGVSQDIKDRIVVTHNVKSNVLGEYHARFSVEIEVKDCNDLFYIDSTEIVFYVVDRIAPIIMPTVKSIVRINLNDSFSYEDHIKITDNHCTQEFLWDHLVVISNDVNTSETSLYSIYFYTEDSVGNKSKVFTLLVEVKDFASIAPNPNIDIDIYPNPTSNTIDINYNARIKTVNIYNTQGQLIRNIEANAETLNNIELGDASSIYYIEIISTEGNYYREKVLKF